MLYHIHHFKICLLYAIWWMPCKKPESAVPLTISLFMPKNIFGKKKHFWQKNIFGHKKHFWSKKTLLTKKNIFWKKKHFWSQKNFWQKKHLKKKHFCQKKTIYVKRTFLDNRVKKKLFTSKEHFWITDKRTWYSVKNITPLSGGSKNGVWNMVTFLCWRQ